MLLRPALAIAMAVADIRPVPAYQFPKFMFKPETALFFAIDLDCALQIVDSTAGAMVADEVTYFVNRDSAGWVEQRVRRRVYIELKLECTRNRCRDNQKARDDWLCVYCRASFPSKLRLTDHRVVGCPCGPVDSTGSKWELPVYPNLKTAKQGKDLKLALQRGDGAVWGSLHDNSVWLELNPELRDVTYPPLGARVQLRQFLEPTVTCLTATPAHAEDVRPQVRSKSQRPPKQPPASTNPAFVVIEDEDEEDEPVTPPSRPKKRVHAQMEDGYRPYVSSRQVKTPPRKGQQSGGERHPSRSARPTTSDGGHRRPPPHPIRVAPIQSRSPSPEMAALLPPLGRTPMPHVPPSQSLSQSPMPHATTSQTPSQSPMPHVTTSQTPMQSSQDLATELRRDRQTYYVKVASAARASVNMSIPKPALRPPLQPPGLWHLMACGLFNFDLACGDFQAFEHEVQKWRTEPQYLDRFYAAYGRFHDPEHQVQPALSPLAFMSIVIGCGKTHMSGFLGTCYSNGYVYVTQAWMSMSMSMLHKLSEHR